jgi:subtilisin family serine protease
MWDCSLDKCVSSLKTFDDLRDLCFAYGFSLCPPENATASKTNLANLERAGFGTVRKLLNERLVTQCRHTGLSWETIVAYRLAARWSLFEEVRRARSWLAKDGWEDKAILKLSTGMALRLADSLSSGDRGPIEAVIQMADVLAFERIVELSPLDRLNLRRRHAQETQGTFLGRLELKPDSPDYVSVWLSNQFMGTFQPWQLQAAASHASVRGISPNFRLRACVDQAKARVRAKQLFTNCSGKGQIVALVDSGVDDQHPDLAGRVEHKKHYTTGNSEDDFGHGTHLGGIIGGKCSRGYGGVAPESTIWCYRVLDDTGHSSLKDVTDAIQQVVDDAVAAVQSGQLASGNKVVANCSVEVPQDEFVGADDYEAFCDHFDHACTDLVVVAAAGNCGPQPASITAPGGGYRVLTVGSSANRGSGILNVVAPFSSRGPAFGNRVKPDVIAPGGFENPEGDTYEDVSVLSSRVKGSTLDSRRLRDKPWRHDLSDTDHYGLSGTSQAAALVSGLAALLVQHAVKKHGATSHAFISDAITTTARTLHYSRNEEGRGLVDADTAMNAV